MAEYSWPVGTLAERQDTIARLLWVLYRHGGSIVNEDGRSVGVFLSLLAENGVEITGGWLNKTILDLGRGGKFGHFLDRDVSGKRTYSIKLVRDPFKHPFPADPYGDYDTDEAEEEEPAMAEIEVEATVEDLVDDVASVIDEVSEEAEVVEVDDVDDLDDLIAASTRAATTAVETTRTSTPSTALERLPEPGRTDKILYAISLLHDVLREDAERDVSTIVATQFAEFNRIAEENRELRDEVERLRGDKARLASALRQATSVMQTAAQNGTGAGVPA